MLPRPWIGICAPLVDVGAGVLAGLRLDVLRSAADEGQNLRARE